MNTIVTIFSDEVFCPLFKRHVVAITGHYVRTELYRTQPENDQLSSSENATFIELDKLQEKAYPQRKFTTVEQLKLAIIDDTETLGSALLIANERCPGL